LTGGEVGGVGAPYEGTGLWAAYAGGAIGVGSEGTYAPGAGGVAVGGASAARGTQLAMGVCVPQRGHTLYAHGIQRPHPMHIRHGVTGTPYGPAGEPPPYGPIVGAPPYAPYEA